MEFFERIKQVITACAGGNQSAFVRQIEEHTSTFNGYLSPSGQDRIKAKTLRQILVKFGVDANWLLLGEGAMFRSASPAQAVAPLDPITARMDQVAKSMREAGVDELRVLEAARDMLEGEIRKMQKERGGYGVAEAAPGMPKAAEEPGGYGTPGSAAGGKSV